jgi:hypothetical protein
MTTVLFDTRTSFLDKQSLMHKYFQDNPNYNIKPVSVFHDHVSYNNYRFLKNTELLSTYWDTGNERYSKSMLVELEEKYGIINFWHIVASDRFIRNWKRGKIIRQISFYFFAWETIIEKYKPDYVVSETVTGLWNYVLFLLCKHNGIKYLSYQTTKNTGRYYFSNDQYGSWDELESGFKELVKKGLSDEEVIIAKEFVQKFREKQLIPPYMKSSTAFPNLIMYINFPRLFINLRKDIVQNWLYNNHDYKLGYRISEFRVTFVRLVRILYTKISKVFEVPSKTDKYILFPIQFQPEATTEIFAPFYRDQIFTIRSIARSLPFAYYLYVKEHSAMPGSKPVKFYKEIRKIPNCKLIDPKNSIEELIANSSAVIVITATTGLESILLNKPTIVFGKVFYNIYPHIFKVRELDDLPHLIKSAIDSTVDENDPHRLAFIYLYSQMGYKSDIYAHQLTDRNVIAFSNELIDQISNYKNRPDENTDTKSIE